MTSSGTVAVDTGKTLKLNGVTLTGGAIANSGTIQITGDGSIVNNALANDQLTVDSGKTLSLNNTTITDGTVTNSGSLDLTGGGAR